jgi:hypothetical protein
MTDRILKALLRLFGTSSLFALVFVAAPHAWMQDIHAGLGLGEMPNTPVVWYLARSTSAFYAMLGGLFWVVSFDLRRHQAVLVYLSAAVTVFGVALFVIDLFEGLPAFWTFWEGPIVTGFGLAMSYLIRNLVPASPPRTRDHHEV